MQETLISKKRRGPQPTGVGTPVMVRMAEQELAALDNWRKAQNDLPSRPEAVRRLLKYALNARVVENG